MNYYEWQHHEDPIAYEEDIEGLMLWWGKMAATDSTYKARPVGVECVSFLIHGERPPVYFIPDTSKDKRLLLKRGDRIRYFGEGEFRLVRNEE